MTKKKSVFRGYTEEEIADAEECTYIIQAGSDAFEVNGCFVFSKAKANFYYKKIAKELISQLNSGTKKDQKNTMIILHSLKILPLRIQ